MPFYLVCFDITDDQIRLDVGKCLSEYGVRVQKSVFEIFTRSNDITELLKEQIALLLEEDDDLRFYKICKPCRDGSFDLEGNPIASMPSSVIL